jgi:pilus assembly protein Flp/PilA
MTTLLNRLVREESGQDLLEYGLLIGIITAVVVAAIGTLGARVQKYFDDVNEAIK